MLASACAPPGRMIATVSQPTPKWRSATAFARAGVRLMAPSRASNTTKSLPRPCIFTKAVMQGVIVGRGVLFHCLDISKFPGENCHSRPAPDHPMRVNLFALLLGSVLATGAFAVTADTDPYAWLEDVHGA